MKYYIYIIAFVFLFSCKKENNNFKITTLNIDVNQRINDIYFIDDINGFAVGGERYDGGFILKTDDGGNTWHKLDSTHFIFKEGNILQTLNSIDFLNDSIGEIVGHGGKILRTDDGGNTWDVILHGSWENFYDIKLFSKNKSLISAGGAYESGTLFDSENLWYSFERKNYSYAIRDIYFIDENIGFTAGYGHLQKTIDGGKTWKLLDIKDDYFFDITFPTDKIGFMCGWEGGLYKTENSGNTWKIINNTNLFFSKRYHFENISFINEQIGVVSAYNGEILYTNNSGKSWSIINSKINTDFHSILMVNENTFFVGGNDGVFLKISL